MEWKEAKKQVSETYELIKPIVKETVAKNTKEIDNIIDKIKKNLTNLTNKELQDYMLQLSIEAYYFAERKDMSLLMQECAIALSKGAQADIYNRTEGTQAYRNNMAIVDSMDKQTVAMIQSAIANCMKSKLDEAHRIVNVLSNVLISKNAENKLKGVRDDESNICRNSVPENRS
ncbi:MAG: hypothetical protein IJZ79_01855 [Bacilli bacterium]|nr:hypothetical protein [Bacilli bacterium]